MDFEGRFKVLMGLTPDGEEIIISEETESKDKFEDNNNG